MAKEVICPACGAKMKAGRVACLRCREKLVAAPSEKRAPSPFSQFIARRRAPLLAAGIVFPLVAAWVVIAFENPKDQASRPSTQTIAAAKAPERDSAVAVAAPVTPAALANEWPFVDSGRAGTGAYARGDFASAIASYTQAVEKNPKDLTALNNLGQALARVGRAAEAIPYFERAIALNGRVWEPRFNLGHAYGLLNDWPNAVAAYRAAAQVFPDDYVTCYNLGLALHKMGQEEAAIPELRKAIELAPGEASFHLSLGVSYERLQKPADAIQAYEAYLNMAPSAPDAQQVRTHIDSLKKPS